MQFLELIRAHDSVLHVKLNRPEKMNALSGDLVEELHHALDTATAEGNQAVVFEGNGKNFSAGFDFGDVVSLSPADLCWRFIRIQQLLQKVATSSLLTVSLAHGRNFGAGADLFAACSWRIASPEATFRMPGLKFGVVLGTSRFAALAGEQAARNILESSATFNAEQAVGMGFATESVQKDDWLQVMNKAGETAGNLDPAARRLLCQALSRHDYAKDMDLLVQSVTVSGFKERIMEYLGAGRG